MNCYRFLHEFVEKRSLNLKGGKTSCATGLFTRHPAMCTPSPPSAAQVYTVKTIHWVWILTSDGDRCRSSSVTLFVMSISSAFVWDVRSRRRGKTCFSSLLSLVSTRGNTLKFDKSKTKRLPGKLPQFKTHELCGKQVDSGQKHSVFFMSLFVHINFISYKVYGYRVFIVQ